MSIVGEIREGFAAMKNNGAITINGLPDEYPAYVIRFSEGYGVAIAVDKELVVAERFNNCRFHTGLLAINGSPSNYLILSSAFEEYRHEFAALCAQFVDPGDNGTDRNSIITDPLSWWQKWKELVGNTNRDPRVYNVIAEMIVLDYKYQRDKSTKWAATIMGSHDIECDTESCEVKSTLKRYGADIVISGQHQLSHKKPLFLYFCRMEESLEGLSINDMKKILVDDGYDEGKLELDIQKQGFENGANIRNLKFKVLEKRKYIIDENFPQIVDSSFKDNKFPSGITHIQYTVDLDGLDYEIW